MILVDIVDPIVSALGESGKWLASLEIGTVLIRLFLAIFLSGIIGMERAVKRHAAGLRTYVLVCVASCIAMLADLFLFETYNAGDPARIGAQVISGIGFLGAGTILVTSRNHIKGLTTAAGLWACACLGLAIGAGFYTVSLIGFILIAIALLFMPKLEHLFTKRTGRYELHIEFEERASLKEFVSHVRSLGMEVIQVENNPAYANSGLSVYTILISNKNVKLFKEHGDFVEDIKKLPYVEFVEEIY